MNISNRPLEKPRPPMTIEEQEETRCRIEEKKSTNSHHDDFSLSMDLGEMLKELDGNTMKYRTHQTIRPAIGHRRAPSASEGCPQQLEMDTLGVVATPAPKNTKTAALEIISIKVTCCLMGNNSIIKTMVFGVHESLEICSTKLKINMGF